MNGLFSSKKKYKFSKDIISKADYISFLGEDIVENTNELKTSKVGQIQVLMT